MTQKHNKLLPIITIILLMSQLLSLSGCGNKTEVSKEVSQDLSATTSSLLEAVTPDFIDLKGMDREKRLVTINISDFAQYSIEPYIEWVQDTYSDENTAIVVFKSQYAYLEDITQAKEYLMKNGYEGIADADFDLTSINVCLMSETKGESEDETKQIASPIKLEIRVSYPLIHAIEGFEINLKYEDKVWSVAEVIPTYMS